MFQQSESFELFKVEYTDHRLFICYYSTALLDIHFIMDIVLSLC